MDNLELYNRVRNVPVEAQKPYDTGSFKGTDINPMWRIKKLTEEFGVCGFGWYYEPVSIRSEQIDDNIMTVVDINLYIKMGGEWSKPIFGTGGNMLKKMGKSGAKVSDEGYKMALTDALSVACKALGIGADIYFGLDRTKYTKNYDTSQNEQNKKSAPQTGDAPGEEPPQTRPEMATSWQIKTITDKLNAISPVNLIDMQNKYGKNLERLTRERAGEALQKIRQMENESA